MPLRPPSNLALSWPGVRRLAALSALAMLAAVGCTLLRPLDDLEPGPKGSAGASGVGGVAGSPGLSGAGAGGVGGSGAGGAARECEKDADCEKGVCDEGKGSCGPCPEGTSIARFESREAFCIAKNEVTQAEYEVFWRGVKGGTIVPRSSFAGCQDHAGYDPAAAPGGDGCRDQYRPAETPNLPVTCVDFCDAAAYCVSIGRRLCGNQLGEPLGTAQESKRDGDEWFLACSGPLPGNEYPYAGPFDAAACNVQSGASAPAEVGSFGACRTAGGVSDLSGNVAEWGGGCFDTSAAAPCWVRGGSFRTEEPGHVACAIPDKSEPAEARFAPRDTRRDDLGIRCCMN